MWSIAIFFGRRQPWEGVLSRNHVAGKARTDNHEVHMGRLFGIMVQKGSELKDNDDRNKYKYRVVFQGNNVVDQDWETAIFQDLGSSPATMEAGKIADAYGCLRGNATQQADAEQAYIQAELRGLRTWVALPEEAWPTSWCPAAPANEGEMN